MSVQSFDSKVNDFFGDKKFLWKMFGDKKIESPKFEYPILYGVEMEYEVNTPEESLGTVEARHLYRGQTADRLEPTYNNFAIVKHDGSLQNGFEVVSIPMSLDAHKEQWKPFFAVAAKSGLTVRRTCGMHVHVSRELLTPLQIGKIMAFICSKENATFIKTIAGRIKPVYSANHTYVEIGNKKITDVNKHHERYSAINLRGEETIEFRFFRSTLNIIRMLQNLEFCDALIRFTWPSNASVQEIKEGGLKIFAQFILENRKHYPYLAEFMKDHHYISWPIRKIPAKYKKELSIPKSVKIIKKKEIKKSVQSDEFDNLDFIEMDRRLEEAQRGVFVL